METCNANGLGAGRKQAGAESLRKMIGGGTHRKQAGAGSFAAGGGTHRKARGAGSEGKLNQDG
ncbi:MAG: hypothetical protein V1911_04410 [Candidatus Micrarchaeota archaeon]